MRNFLKINSAIQPWQLTVDSVMIKKVEQRLIKQLLQALMYEKVIEFDIKNDSNTGSVIFNIHCQNQVYYSAQGHIHYSFGIIRLNKSDVLYYQHGLPKKATLERVIKDILLPIEGAKLKEQFISELRRTFIHDVQSNILTADRTAKVDALNYEQLESHLTFGHPYHPCYKSRIGFSLTDNYRYGHEFEQDINLIWLAVKKTLLVSNTVDLSLTADEWIQDYLGIENYKLLKRKLSQIDIEHIDCYGLIPVHPWQWENTLINALHPLIQSGEIICLGVVGCTYRSQQSIRSLSWVSKKGSSIGKPYLKLAMHLTNTSSTRILAKHTVMNGPIITAWLNSLVEDDHVAKSINFAFLGETVGISLDHEVLYAEGYQHPNIYGGLAAIWRENVQKYLSKSQQAFPLNGVSFIQSDGSALIHPWLVNYGVENWTKRLIQVTVLPVLHLLFAHGIALESHAQNIVLIHQDGYPVKILLKDLHDGVRYSKNHLAQPHLAPKLYNLPDEHAALNRGSFIETADTDGIRDMTVACLFFIALADIAIFLQTHYQYEEQLFWHEVAMCIFGYQKANPQHQSRFKIFDIFSKKTRIESLTKRRLFGDEVFPVKFINNPLYNIVSDMYL